MATNIDKKHNEKIYFIRLNLNERIQHGIFFSCFFTLALTGFMIYIPEDIVALFGKFGETIFLYRSLVHRIAAVIMVLVCAYHLFYLLFKKTGRLFLVDMFPRFKDVFDIKDNLLYYIGFKKEAPEFDRFSYKQKAEYGALIAGNTLMTLSGLILWFEAYWYKFIIDIAKVVHGMEAVLACLAIIIWHLYEVHLKPRKFPIDSLWITGIIDEEEMKEEYPMHYKRIMKDPKLKDIFIYKQKN
ncbi:MAG: cytochrome b/b6 domain-containing protein [Pseudomonadota bacterium]